LGEITRETVILLLDQIIVVIVIVLYSPYSYSELFALVTVRGFFPTLGFHVKLVCRCFVFVIVPLVSEYLFHSIASTINLL